MKKFLLWYYSRRLFWLRTALGVTALSTASAVGMFFGPLIVFVDWIFYPKRRPYLQHLASYYVVLADSIKAISYHAAAGLPAEKAS